MFLKCILNLFISLSLFFSVQLNAQERENDTIRSFKTSTSRTELLQPSRELEWKTTTSPFIEVLGKGFLSFNVDFRPKETYAISIGIQPMEGLLPNVMYYHFSGVRRRFEVGVGISAGFSGDFNPEVILYHGVIGYRYQKKKGIFFRVGFTPLYVMFLTENERNNFYPFPGLSLGYSF